MNQALIIDKHLKSWIHYPDNTDFPIQNLPLGIFSMEGESKRVCTIIGDTIIDLHGLSSYRILNVPHFATSDFEQDSLNHILQKGKTSIRELRKDIFEIFDSRNHIVNKDLCKMNFYTKEEVILHLPVKPNNYTDFYSSREHATNVGMMFRDPANALLPNWLHLPVAYHGRASSIVVSGTNIIRPKGQMQLKEGDAPVFGPTKQLDLELEMAFVIGHGNKLGHPVSIEHAESHIQGMLIFNDWSARDIQKWEYVPLGPFLGKNFGSTASPWLVDLDALQAFKVKGPEPTTPLLDYLKITEPSNFDIQLEVILVTPNGDENIICKSNMKYLYWSMSQQLAHHTVNGCNMEGGDICASGTISGPTPDTFGSLMELAWKGTKPLKMKDGSERSFLQDGDTVIIHAYAQGEHYRIGFGEARGKILAAI